MPSLNNPNATNANNFDAHQPGSKLQHGSEESSPVSPLSSIAPLLHHHNLHSSTGYLETESRFWEFKIEDATTYVRYGHIRPNGQLKERATQTLHHRFAEDARQFIESMIDDKLKSGYVGWARW